MTKAKLKEQYDNWNQANGWRKQEENTQIFKSMQELNKNYGTGTMWCSINQNLRDIITKEGQRADVINRAMELYAKYHENNGRWESLKELALATNNFEI